MKVYLYIPMFILLYISIKICKYKHIIILIMILCLQHTAFARESVYIQTKKMALDINNLQKIAFQNEIPLWALFGILATERGQNGQALKNENGTWDLGIFQINTIHLNKLHALGIEPQLILVNGNINAAVAGWLLGKNYKEQNDIWEAIGNYHSKTPRYKAKYIKKVQDNLELLVHQKNVNTLIDYVNRDSYE